jgi:hypothetical protein
MNFSPLESAPFLKHLEFFRIGEVVNFEDDTYNCRTIIENLASVVARMENLQELQWFAHESDEHGATLEKQRLFALPNLRRLKTLIVYHGHDVYPLRILAANPALQSLERIRMHPSHNWGDDEGGLPLTEVIALLHSPNLPSLKHLHLHASSMSDSGCAEIVHSGILKRLETLDLRHGGITDVGAHLLAQCEDIRHLKYLSFANNEISEEGCEVLQRLPIPTLRLENQSEVGSRSYFYSGDME